MRTHTQGLNNPSLSIKRSREGDRHTSTHANIRTTLNSIDPRIVAANSYTLAVPIVCALLWRLFIRSWLIWCVFNGRSVFWGLRCGCEWKFWLNSIILYRFWWFLHCINCNDFLFVFSQYMNIIFKSNKYMDFDYDKRIF